MVPSGPTAGETFRILEVIVAVVHPTMPMFYFIIEGLLYLKVFTLERRALSLSEWPPYDTYPLLNI